LDFDFVKWLYLNGYTFVLVGHLDIMNMDVEAPYINSVESAFIPTSNDEIIDLSTSASVKDEVECWG
jgi:hypothetical protein